MKDDTNKRRDECSETEEKRRAEEREREMRNKNDIEKGVGKGAGRRGEDD